MKHQEMPLDGSGSFIFCLFFDMIILWRSSRFEGLAGEGKDVEDWLSWHLARGLGGCKLSTKVTAFFSGDSNHFDRTFSTKIAFSSFLPKSPTSSWITSSILATGLIIFWSFFGCFFFFLTTFFELEFPALAAAADFEAEIARPNEAEVVTDAFAWTCFMCEFLL